MSARKAAKQSETFEPDGLTRATSLRPETVARLELLRIVTAWRPMWDASKVTEAAAELEKFISGK